MKNKLYVAGVFYGGDAAPQMVLGIYEAVSAQEAKGKALEEGEKKSHMGHGDIKWVCAMQIEEKQMLSILQLNPEHPVERQRRIYYQDIVYYVCNIFDQIDGKSVNDENILVCGTLKTPTTQVQDRMDKLKKHLRVNVPSNKCDRYEKALIEIRDQDYRGNRSTESWIAERALEYGN